MLDLSSITKQQVRQESDRNVVRYLKAMQLVFFSNFKAAFHSPHRGRLFNALHSGGVSGKVVCLLDTINQGITVAVRRGAGCTTSFDVVTGVRECDKRQCLSCSTSRSITLHSKNSLEYGHTIVIFAKSSTKLQHDIDFVLKQAGPYGLHLSLDECNRM
ncbi:hypothetical protein RB195_023028 [Necator americanus]|uniref:Uncharacterized protein n=1 Tax=Necator americanus TaxID=51031 RepID=A0ABR1EHH5_NECAM